MQPGMGAGCEGGRCGFLLPALRISTKDTKGHEGKRRRRSQGDDRKSGPCTAAGADWEQGRSSLLPVCCAPSLVQFTVSEPDMEGGMAAFRRFDTIQMQLAWRWGRVQPGMGTGCEGGRCGFLLPASRISTKDTKGHEGKRRRRSQGDDRKSGPCTAAGADWEQGRSSLLPVCCAPSFVQFTVSEPDLEEIMAAFRCFDPIQMQLPWRNWGGCSPEWGRGVKGGDAASFCQLQGYPRRTQRGTKESGDGDPREMTANLDRAPPPARTGNRADRVFNPLAARHHWCNLQCLNPDLEEGMAAFRRFDTI